jgi:hypothetical protein
VIRARSLLWSIDQAFKRIGVDEFVGATWTGTDLRGRIKVKIQTRQGVEFKRDDGTYVFPPDAEISWSGTAEDALARLACVPDNAGWEGFYDSFDGELKASSAYF